MTKTYTVVCTVQYPAWNERDGIHFRGIEATTKAEAVAKAKRFGWHYGILEKDHGRKAWKAYEGY